MQKFFTNLFSSKKRKKKFNIIITILGIAVLISGMTIYLIVNKQNQELLEDGVRQEVIVLKKNQTGTRKNPHYLMDVAFNSKMDSVPQYIPKDTIGLTEEQKFSEVFKRAMFKGKYRKILGKAESFRINFVNGKSYSNLKIGDKAIFVYFEDNPSKGRLLMEIE